jgi:PAS domain-containing protein
VTRDLTERNQTAEALKKASIYTRSLIEASLDPLVTISPEGKITDVNGATEKVTGCTRQQPLVGTISAVTSPPRKRPGRAMRKSSATAKCAIIRYSPPWMAGACRFYTMPGLSG